MNEQRTNLTHVYDGYTATATIDSEPFRANMIYDTGVDEPTIVEKPREKSVDPAV